MKPTTTRPATGTGFFNRRTELEILESCLRNRQFVAVIGPRRIGKSSLVQEFLRCLNESRKDAFGFRFEVHKNITSPSVFAVRLFCVFLGEFINQRHSHVSFDRVAPQVDPRQFAALLGVFDSPAMDKLLQFLLQHLPAHGPTGRPILERVLTGLDQFAQEQDITLAVAMDEFQEITKLERYNGGFDKDTFLGFWEGTTSAMSNTWFAVTGSMVKIMEEVMLSGTSPLYGRYEHLRLRGFVEEDSRTYLMSLIGKALPAEVVHFVSVLCEGHPYYLTVLGQSVSRLCSSRPSHALTLDDVRGVVLDEIHSGALANHCRYVFEVSLAHARRGNSLAQILEVIARSNAETASELAKLTAQQPGEISPLLQNLVEVDLLHKDGARYVIPDRIFKMWLECVYGLTSSELQRLRRRISESYEESIARLKEDRGLLLEYAVRELMGKFDGRKFDGRSLPSFEQVQQLHLDDPEGIVQGSAASHQEIDAYGRGTHPWMVEVRWRTRATPKKEIELIQRKRKLLEQTLGVKTSLLAVISVSGFTAGAMEQANETEDLWLLDGSSLQRLFRDFGMAPPKTLGKDRN